MDLSGPSCFVLSLLALPPPTMASFFPPILLPPRRFPRPVSFSFCISPPWLISWASPPFCDMKFEQQRVIRHEPNEYLRRAAAFFALFPPWAQSVAHSLIHSPSTTTTTIGFVSERGREKENRKRVGQFSHRRATSQRRGGECAVIVSGYLPRRLLPPVPLQPPKPPPQVRPTW